MAGPNRVGRDLKQNKGRIIRVEQYLGRLEKRVEKLEKENAALKAKLSKPIEQASGKKLPPLVKQGPKFATAIAKLEAKVVRNRADLKQHSAEITQLSALREPVRALAKSFKQTPGAPFAAWTSWMLSTFRKQGVYRKPMFK